MSVVPVEVVADTLNHGSLQSAKIVCELAPDIASIARMDLSGVIVTAPGNGQYDPVSRYFALSASVISSTRRT